jgi:hypothetical protein
MIAWQQAGKAGVRSTSGNVRARLLLDLTVAGGNSLKRRRLAIAHETQVTSNKGTVSGAK